VLAGLLVYPAALVGTDEAAGPEVLVVEDDEAVRAMMRAALAEAGYRVQAAANGQGALAVLRVRRPDAIVLDLRMPVMDGWAFRDQQLAIPGLRDIPVVVVTAADAPSPDFAPAAVLAKPFRVEELVALVGAAIGRVEPPA
jgi:CheY-like chemotaxis protein